MLGEIQGSELLFGVRRSSTARPVAWAMSRVMTKLEATATRAAVTSPPKK